MHLFLTENSLQSTFTDLWGVVKSYSISIFIGPCFLNLLYNSFIICDLKVVWFIFITCVLSTSVGIRICFLVCLCGLLLSSLSCIYENLYGIFHYKIQSHMNKIQFFPVKDKRLLPSFLLSL